MDYYHYETNMTASPVRQKNQGNSSVTSLCTLANAKSAKCKLLLFALADLGQ